jgi:hypothetical protein
MEIAVLLWLALCVAAGMFASRFNRSGIGWFLVSFLFSPIIGFAFIAALGPAHARPITAGYQPITEHAPPKAEDAPVSMIEAYSRACADRELRRAARSW